MIPMIQNEYFLESTRDLTDRTRDIEEKLATYGTCILGSGVFCVKGVDMPDGTTLYGMGKATKLLLDSSVAEGYTVRMSSYCTVRGIWFCGSESPWEQPETVGTRHGLLFRGTATLRDWSNQPEHSIVDGCFMTDFTGGGLTCVDTGYSVHAALTVSNCHMTHCGAGINISHYSEYHRFSNLSCVENLYGCINNGGNNVFSACLFDANKVGFVIDNSKHQSPNHSHGSVTGCTFNHSDNNHGIGILLMGATNGFIFTGCQCFYSRIVVDHSANIVFSSFNFGGRQEIAVTGGKQISFADCVFATSPTITVEDNPTVRFDRCYTMDGNDVNV